MLFIIFIQRQKWDTQAIDMTVFDVDDEFEAGTITCKSGGGWRNAYGKYHIKPKDYIRSFEQNNETNGYQIIHSWKIKIIKATILMMNIGVVICSKIESIEKMNRSQGFRMSCAFNYKDAGYGVYLCFKTKYGPQTDKYETNRGDMKLKFENGDIVEIVLLFKDHNYENCYVGYTKNGSEIELAFDDLDVNESYALAVAFHRINDAVEILDYP